MLRFKLNPLELLKAKGITQVQLRKDATFGQATMQKMRHRQICSMNELDRLCGLTEAQPGDLVEWVQDDAGGE